jgi:hypothetical protein
MIRLAKLRSDLLCRTGNFAAREHNDNESLFFNQKETQNSNLKVLCFQKVRDKKLAG